MLSGTNKIGRGFTFKQDNDLEHTSNLCDSYLERKNKQVISILWNGRHNHSKGWYYSKKSTEVERTERMQALDVIHT